MTVPFYSLLATMILLIATKVPVAIAMNRLGGYDNELPRQQQARLKGWGARALASHQNAFEAFSIFAVAVFIAHLGEGDPIWAARLAIIHVLARVMYSCFYLMNWDKIRSVVWSIGYFTSIGLALLPIL